MSTIDTKFVDIEKLNLQLEKKQQLSEEDLSVFTNQLFLYYRKTGFPNYQKNDKDILNSFLKIKLINSCKYYDDNSCIFQKYPQLNGFLFSYFPNWINVECNNQPSLIDCWNDDEKLKSCIKKTLQWLPKHNEKWSENRLRQNSKVFCSGQSVSNFNPVTAKQLYNMYGHQGTVLDMCCGWGGRLLGFTGSNCNSYIGYEPCTDTYNGLVELKSDYENIFHDKTIVLNRCGCENMELEDESVDFAFTSPPYFDCEKYSDEDTQSWKRYPTADSWTTDFLYKTFTLVYKALKPSCIMAINIANTTVYDWIEDACVDSAKNAGFNLIDTKWYQISAIKSEKSNKLEPIFIFKKVS